MAARRPLVGHNDCNDCTGIPSHRLVPCQHTICLLHFNEEAAGNRAILMCGCCYQDISYFLPLSVGIDLGTTADNSQSNTYELDGSSITDPSFHVTPGRNTGDGSHVDNEAQEGAPESVKITPEPFDPVEYEYETPIHEQGNVTMPIGPQGPGFTATTMRMAIPAAYAEMRGNENAPWNASCPTRVPRITVSSSTFDDSFTLKRETISDPFLGGPKPSFFFPQEMGFTDACRTNTRAAVPPPSMNNMITDSANKDPSPPTRNLPTSTGSPLGKTSAERDHVAQARYLANLIKSGGVKDIPSDSTKDPAPKTHGEDSAMIVQNPDPLASSTAPWPFTSQRSETLPMPRFMLPGEERPSFNEAMSNVPFVDTARTFSGPCNYGVVRISNIPYICTKNEVLSVISRGNSVVKQPASSPYFAVHIIMERQTGKTMDAFVELKTPEDAVATVEAFHHRLATQHKPHIGPRNIYIHLSSQAELMSQLFPRAKSIVWQGSAPVLTLPLDPPGTTFSGFVTGEEMLALIKHTAAPHRSHYSSRFINRAYDSMISTLHKYPWFAGQLISLGQRDLIYQTTLNLIRHLAKDIDDGVDPTHLNTVMLQELSCAALTCPGFSEPQKQILYDTLSSIGFSNILDSLRITPLGRLGRRWRFQALGRQPGAQFAAILYYVSMMANAFDGIQGERRNYTRVELTGLSRGFVIASLPAFGNMVVNYGRSERQMGSMSLADAAWAEWNAIQSLLARALVTPLYQRFGR